MPGIKAVEWNGPERFACHILQHYKCLFSNRFGTPPPGIYVSKIVGNCTEVYPTIPLQPGRLLKMLRMALAHTTQKTAPDALHASCISPSQVKEREKRKAIAYICALGKRKPVKVLVND
ncbi:Transmembrane Emp24 Domain-Containing Protein 2 [Manis pentadactyla]|nr:Transmembrane Emp24 Domain-Containing Protein 2 [Manis pentadactyla]